MGITSLLATAYNLVLIPTKQTSPGTGGEGARKLELQLTPLQRYVPHLNLALTLLIAWTGASMKDNREVFDTFWVICQVPLSMPILLIRAHAASNICRSHVWHDLRGKAFHN